MPKKILFCSLSGNVSILDCLVNLTSCLYSICLGGGIFWGLMSSDGCSFIHRCPATQLSGGSSWLSDQTAHGNSYCPATFRPTIGSCCGIPGPSYCVEHKEAKSRPEIGGCAVFPVVMNSGF